jgi:DNA-binding MarR family transcriptional regulator
MDRAELTKEIIKLQHRLNRAQRLHEQDAWLELNLSIGQVKSLFFIATQGTTNFSKLAAALGVTSPNVTGIIDRLVEQGLVSRQENPENRRMLMLLVTEKGETLIAALRERAVSQMSETLDHLSVAELNTVAQGLSLLVRASDANDEKSLQAKPVESR